MRRMELVALCPLWVSSSQFTSDRLDGWFRLWRIPFVPNSSNIPPQMTANESGFLFKSANRRSTLRVHR